MKSISEMQKMRKWVRETNTAIVAAELVIHERKIKELLERVKKLEGRQS